MDEPDLMNFIRQQLARRLSELQWNASDTVLALKNGGGAYPEPMDYAPLQHDRQVALIVRRRECNEIRKIREAIRRMENGVFGMCVFCGASIAEQRLLAEPTSQLCLGCQDLAEQRIYSSKYRHPVSLSSLIRENK